MRVSKLSNSPPRYVAIACIHIAGGRLEHAGAILHTSASRMPVLTPSTRRFYIRTMPSPADAQAEKALKEAEAKLAESRAYDERAREAGRKSTYVADAVSEDMSV